MSKAGPGFGERQLVALLQSRFATQAPGVEIGIGDDAAVLQPMAGKPVCSVDVQVEGVHFDLKWLSLQDVGYRAMQAALSDLAAMGAKPVAALSSWILPSPWDRSRSEELIEGQQRASLESQCPVVGGNVSRGRELSVTTTVLGSLELAPLRREGAQSGQEVWLMGQVGCAAAGLLALRRWAVRKPQRLALPGIRECVQAWRSPRALLAEGLSLGTCATAAVDVSDGLAEDARQLAEASGVRVELNEELLRRALPGKLRGAARALRISPLRLALYGGEDYTLLATGSARQRPVGARVIGRVGLGRGLQLRTKAGFRALGRGFDHLSP